MRRSLTAVLALSLCSASALAADTLRIDIKGLDGDLAANARAWVEPLEKAGYTDTPAARMNVDKAVRLSLRALGYYQPAVSMTVKDKRSLEITVVPGEPVLISDVDVHVTGPGADERVFKFLQKRRVPKKGFTNIFRTEYATVNVGQLEVFDNGTVVTAAMLKEAKIIRKTLDGVKVLGNGELTKKLTVEAAKFTASAKEKIEALGGKAEVK